MARFSESLNRKMEEIHRPPNPPVGHYVWQIEKHPEIEEFTTRDGREFERITFPLIAVRPGEDVDPDELKEYGKLDGYRNRKVFMAGDSEEDPASFERTMFNIKRFLEHCGVEAEDLSEAFAASVNQQFLGELNHRPDPNDPEIVYAEVGKTAEV